MAITFEGHILMKPITIRAKIDSGLMGIDFNSEEEAKKIIDLLAPFDRDNKIKDE